MEFEWDPEKSESNRQVRGFDFAFASQIFDGSCIGSVDRRRDYGEERILALGIAAGVPLAVVFTDRARPDGTVVRRIISARPSKTKERLRHAEASEVP
jgi:uncharacterized DUF497 family protein